jgi:2-iminobutanoate/2-iminopropanoate deaminase
MVIGCPKLLNFKYWRRYHQPAGDNFSETFLIIIYAFLIAIFVSINTYTMRRTTAILAILVTLATQSKAQSAPNVQLINPATVAAPRGYSHAAVIDLGNCKMVIMSGQVAFDQKGNLVGPNDIAKQTEQVFRNIKSIVEAAGGNMNHLVKLGIFTTDVSRLPELRTIRDQFINTKTPPASTLVQINKLFREDVLIEIEATAIIPK